MQTLFFTIAASFLGGLIFILLQPAIIRLVIAFIRASRRISPRQKERLSSLLQPQPPASIQGDLALLGLYAVSLAAEIYFLYTGNVSSARFMLVGMFLMLFIRSFTNAMNVEQTPS